MVTGISHITFIVSDLERSWHLFTYIFDAKEVYDSGNKNFSVSSEKFFLIGDLWIALMKGESLTERTYNHIAFQVNDENFDGIVAKIKDLKLEIKEGRERIHGEGKSIYFYDYHLFEIHTGTLKERLAVYTG